MLNGLWLFLIVGGMAFGCAHGACAEMGPSLFSGAEDAVKLAIDLAAIVAFWFGVSRLAEKSGMLGAVGNLFRPALRRLFRSVPADHQALDFVTMNVTANLLGLGNAATPFGLRAMQAMKELGPGDDVATPDMITFLVLNSATVNLVPAGMIALRAATGSHDPAATYLTSVLTTMTAATFALALNAVVLWRHGGRR